MSISICRGCASLLRSAYTPPNTWRRLIYTQSAGRDREAKSSIRGGPPRSRSRDGSFISSKPEGSKRPSFRERPARPSFASRPRNIAARDGFSRSWNRDRIDRSGSTDRYDASSSRNRDHAAHRNVNTSSQYQTPKPWTPRPPKKVGYIPRSSFVPKFAGRSSRGSLHNVAESESQPRVEEFEDIDAEEEKPVESTQWRKQKAALKRKLGGETWNPTRKKLSPDTMDGIRAMHQAYPETLTTPVLAKHFDITPEAIRRILKSKWKPSEDEEAKRMARWEKRGKEVWERLVREKGYKPPQKWRDLGVKGPKSLSAISTLGRLEAEGASMSSPKLRGAEAAREALSTARQLHRPEQFTQRGPKMSDDEWWKQNVLPSLSSEPPRMIPEL